MAAAAASSAASSAAAAGASPVVQFVVLRRDLWRSLGWPLGAVVAQGCHAAVAAVWEGREDPGTLQYCAPEALPHMTKVVLEVKGEPQLVALHDKLAAAGVPHHLWREQPEDFPTCLATRPCARQEVEHLFRKLNLCKLGQVNTPDEA